MDFLPEEALDAKPTEPVRLAFAPAREGVAVGRERGAVTGGPLFQGDHLPLPPNPVAGCAWFFVSRGRILTSCVFLYAIMERCWSAIYALRDGRVRLISVRRSRKNEETYYREGTGPEG